MTLRGHGMEKMTFKGMGDAIAGFQPTGDGRLHLGNLLGSAAPFAALEGSDAKFAMVADVHAMSVGAIPAGFRQAKARMLRELMACGLSDGAFLFEQSAAPEILALSSVLATFAPLGDLRRMTQFESKSKVQGVVDAPLSLLAYPCLMAADILGLGAMRAVVGEDQRQHLELARAISRRAKEALGVDFGEPRALELTAAVRIKSLRNPLSKMSKSDADEAGTLYVSDSRDALAKKIKRATTDSRPLPLLGEDFADADRPGLANLLAIAGGCSGASRQEMLAALAGSGHSAVKEMALEAVDGRLSPIRERLAATSDEEVRAISERAAEAARARASRSLEMALGALR